MLGAVSDDGGEPRLPLTLLGSASDVRIEVEAVVDTGFDGELALPPDLIRRLGCEYVGTTGGALADGSMVELHYFVARLLWHDAPRTLAAISAGESPETLLGMELLAGSRLAVDAEPGGPVAITPL